MTHILDICVTMVGGDIDDARDVLVKLEVSTGMELRTNNQGPDCPIGWGRLIEYHFRSLEFFQFPPFVKNDLDFTYSAHQKITFLQRKSL